MSWTHERARVASLSRDRAPDDPELQQARLNLRAERLAAAIRREVDASPPLTAEQIEQLRGLLPYPYPEPAGAGTATGQASTA